MGAGAGGDIRSLLVLLRGELVPAVDGEACVCCVEYDYRPEERVETVRMCRWVQHETVVNQVRCIPVVTQEQIWTVRPLLCRGAVSDVCLRAVRVRLVRADRRKKTD